MRSIGAIALFAKAPDAAPLSSNSVIPNRVLALVVRSSSTDALELLLSTAGRDDSGIRCELCSDTDTGSSFEVSDGLSQELQEDRNFFSVPAY